MGGLGIKCMWIRWIGKVGRVRQTGTEGQLFIYIQFLVPGDTDIIFLLDLKAQAALANSGEISWFHYWYFSRWNRKTLARSPPI